MQSTWINSTLDSIKVKFVCQSPTRAFDLLIASKSESIERRLLLRWDISPSIELKSSLRPLSNSILSVVVIGWILLVLFVIWSSSASFSVSKKAQVSFIMFKENK